MIRRTQKSFGERQGAPTYTSERRNNASALGNKVRERDLKTEGGRKRKKENIQRDRVKRSGTWTAKEGGDSRGEGGVWALSHGQTKKRITVGGGRGLERGAGKKEGHYFEHEKREEGLYPARGG